MGVSMDCPIFSVHPIISGTGKATDFKFGQYIQMVHPNKSPLKILEKRERGRIHGLPIFGFFGYPLLSHERVMLRTSKFACTFIGSIGTKAHSKFRELHGSIPTTQETVKCKLKCFLSLELLYSRDGNSEEYLW